MTVNVLFFGATADIVGSRTIQMQISHDESVSSIFERILNDHPQLSKHDLRFAVNQYYAPISEGLKEGDELAIFTAVSGG